MYGQSKYLGEVRLSSALTIRTSYIGHELASYHGLIDWFLSQTGQVKGFTRALYSGLPVAELCRKHAFVDRISVDLATFGMTLHRAGHSFTRARLSAGENQLLAIATLWALRELSGRATPVIIDTPLSRLDSQHRQSMLHDFFPHASHQVILLATDAEIDAAALKLLAPVIARIYRMEYDPGTGATTHTVETPAVVMPNLTLFEA